MRQIKGGGSDGQPFRKKDTGKIYDHRKTSMEDELQHSAAYFGQIKGGSDGLNFGQ